MKVDVVNAENKKVGSVDLNDDVFGGRIKADLIHESVVRANAAERRGTHMTKNRALVSGSGKKPWKSWKRLSASRERSRGKPDHETHRRHPPAAGHGKDHGASRRWQDRRVRGVEGRQQDRYQARHREAARRQGGRRAHGDYARQAE